MLWNIHIPFDSLQQFWVGVISVKVVEGAEQGGGVPASHASLNKLL